MRVLFIHGRAQEEFDASVLKASWTEAFKQSFATGGRPYPQGMTVEFVYYAKTLVSLLKQYQNAIDRGDYLFRGDVGADMLNAFEQELIIDLADNAKIDARERQVLSADEVVERGWGNNRLVLATLRALDYLFPAAANYSIGKFTADVAAYLIVAAIRNKINDMVVERLTPEPTIIIAHSLGTVIAYNALHAVADADCDVRMLLTLGSPLGVKSVQRQLGGIRYPQALKSAWHNLYDPMDIVSLNPLNEQHFSVEPAIINHSVRNTSHNRHDALSYLTNPSVGKLIAEEFPQ